VTEDARRGRIHWLPSSAVYSIFVGVGLGGWGWGWGWGFVWLGVAWDWAGLWGVVCGVVLGFVLGCVGFFVGGGVFVGVYGFIWYTPIVGVVWWVMVVLGVRVVSISIISWCVQSSLMWFW